MFSKLLNPFEYIAGIKSLVVGLLIIVSTSIAGYFSNTHFPDVISVKIDCSFPLWYLLVQGFLNWLLISTIFYIAALIFSRSAIRFIDVFGTQALARFPYFFAAFTGFSDTLNAFGRYILYTFLQQGEPINLSAFQIASAIVLLVITILLTIWMVALMFQALKVSANLKGKKLTLIFIAGLIISIVAGNIITTLVIKHIL